MSKKIPTVKQIEAYYWTHIVGLNNRESAERIGIHESNVSERLTAFFKIRPELKTKTSDSPNCKNTISVEEVRFYNVKRKF